PIRPGTVRPAPDAVAPCAQFVRSAAACRACHVLSAPGQESSTVDSLPSVRFELRLGSARPTFHEMTDAGFLVGSVPGCDLRLPGAALPPVLCLILRRPDGVVPRKLAPAQPVLVNGRTTALTPLAHGDRITLGAVDLIAHIEPAKTAPAPTVSVATQSSPLTTHHSPVTTHQLDAPLQPLDQHA